MRKLSLFVPLLLAMISSRLLQAAPGDLDTDFGVGGTEGDGKVVTNFMGTSNDRANAIVIQPTPTGDKIVVVGYTAAGTDDSNDFALARYNLDGTPDVTFSTDGLVTTDFGTTSDIDRAYAVALQPDGKVVVAGYTHGTLTGNDFALARYNLDGSLDGGPGDSTPGDSFGLGGLGRVTRTWITSGGTFSNDLAMAVAVQPWNGKVVVAGRTNVSGNNDFALARYNTNGSPDNGMALLDSTPSDTFGTSGQVTTDIGGSTYDTIAAIALQSDHKIVVVGRTFIAATLTNDFALARYNENGSPDGGFGTAGKVTTDFGSSTDDIATAVSLQADGKIVVAGYTAASSIAKKNFALARYNSNGSLDDGTATDTTPGDSFGTSGKVITSIGSSQDVANALLIQPSGKILVGGSTFVPITGALVHLDFALARYNSNGSLDDGTATDTTPGDSFGSGGKVTTNFSGTSRERIAGLAFQSDGKIVAAGYTGGSNDDFAVARYESDPPASSSGPVSCGNSVVEPPEQCDNGPSNSDTVPNACRMNCMRAHCGDSIVDSSEQCDDGNQIDGDGCNATCQTEAAPVPVCGNGTVETGEQCDDGNTNNGDGCSSSCQTEAAPVPVCGNGTVESGEQCDDGNTADGDGCSASCQNESSHELSPPPDGENKDAQAVFAHGGGGFGCSLSVGGPPVVDPLMALLVGSSLVGIFVRRTRPRR